MKKYGKFAALVGVIIGTVVWLGFSGSGASGTYYKTVTELRQMGSQAYGQRVRVGGDVEAGSIRRVGHDLCFRLQWEGQTLNVAYSGSDPVPDTFKDGAQALAEGKMAADGTFHANKIQAKCASKYETKPGMKPGMSPVNSSRKANI